jgi:predicted nucleic acid-binding protein
LAQTVPALLLMDERAGRAVALELGLQVAGTAAVIGMARQRGLIASARQIFECLHQSDFRISPQVIKTLLARVGEA